MDFIIVSAEIIYPRCCSLGRLRFFFGKSWVEVCHWEEGVRRRTSTLGTLLLVVHSYYPQTVPGRKLGTRAAWMSIV
jgi:hypothetical protein